MKPARIRRAAAARRGCDLFSHLESLRRQDRIGGNDRAAKDPRRLAATARAVRRLVAAAAHRGQAVVAHHVHPLRLVGKLAPLVPADDFNGYFMLLLPSLFSRPNHKASGFNTDMVIPHPPA